MKRRDNMRCSRRTVLRWIAGSAAFVATQEFGTSFASAADSVHNLWQRILEKVVSDAGWIDYAAIQKNHSHEMRAYLELLGSTAMPDRSVAGQNVNDIRAFWINAYNAICVQTLLDHSLPVKVPHAKLFGKNIFSQRRYRVAGSIRSLDDIEHQILRKEFGDPRMHASLVCGASSCPRLRPEAYQGVRLDQQLNKECMSWIMNETTLSGVRKNRLDKEKRVFFASKIFDWYDDDFGGDDKGVLAFIARHSSAAQRAFLTNTQVELEFVSYDWRLNKRT